MTRIEAHWLMDPHAQRVCSMLADAGHAAWFVGGCVRNALLDVPVTDLDIATDARPERVMELAEAAGLKSVPTGIDHGTVTIVTDHHPFEVTTFRRDVATDGRRAVVAFSDDIADDARRRDFTMNALYAASDGEVCDPLGGLPDLEQRRVRFIDDAEQRIREDYLRILRFFRFHAWYGDARQGLDADGLAACAELAEGIGTLSRERVGQEMLKLLSAPDPAPAISAMEQSGVLHRVLPGAIAAPIAVLVHIEQQLGHTIDPIRRLALIGGEDVADRLRLSRAHRGRLDALCAAMGSDWSASELGYRLGGERGRDVVLLQSAMAGVTVDAAVLADVNRGAAQVFPVRPADLMPHLSGPDLGAALKQLEAKWIASDFSLSREELLKLDE